MTMMKAYSTCPHDCPSACALEVEKLDDYTIGRVRGAAENSYTSGVVCAKVARYAERVHHPDRLTVPLIKNTSGEFQSASWDTALDLVAGKFTELADEYGSETVWPYFFAGTMGLVNRDGINRLRHVMKYSGQAANICTELVNNGWRAGVGKIWGPDPREMASSDMIVMWGGNPVSTQVNVMTHVAKARKDRGARFIVIDTYRTPTVEAADDAYIVRPGTDAAFACGVMHVLFRDGFADRDYMASHADDWQAFEAHLKSKTPEWAATICGVSAERIEEFAHEYGRTERAFIRVGYGMSRSRNGVVQIHAATCLPTVTGKWRQEGAGALYNFRDIYAVDPTLIVGADAIDPAIRTLDMSRIGPVLMGQDEVVKKGPPVTAMLIQNTNPAVVAPDSENVRRGFSRDDLFLCVQEQFMTETADYADVVLPATTFLEHDDIYTAGGHPHILMGPKVIEGPGETRSNHWVLCELAKRLGAEHPGFEMTEWELIDATLKASGHPSAAELKERRWIDVCPDFNAAHFIDGFPTATGKFQFKPDWSAIGPNHQGLPEFPDHCDLIDNATEDRPFRMVTAPARNYLNSSFTETPTSRKKERVPTVKIHPEPANKLGIGDADKVLLGNDQGQVELTASLFDGVQPGTVIVESVWPGRDFPDGIGINKLVSADPGLPNGGAVFHDTAVWVKKAG